MEKGLYLVDWMADERGLYRVPMLIHAQEGAFLCMSWPDDGTLADWGVPVGKLDDEGFEYWRAFHEVTREVFEELHERKVWVNMALVRSMRPLRLVGA